MGIGKEAEHEFGKLEAMQVQIYPDAADAGIRVTGFDDPFVLKIKQYLEDDFLTGAFTKHRSTFNYGSGCYGWTTQFYIAWEPVGSNQYRATEWTINYIVDKVRKVQFVSIMSRLTVVPESKL